MSLKSNRPRPEDMSRDDVTRLLTEFAALHTGNGAAAVGDDNATLSHMSDDPAYLERFVIRSRALASPEAMKRRAAHAKRTNQTNKPKEGE